MILPIYQVDAFTNGPFTGNPAAVCPLENWLPDEVMQAIAEENNLAETAFFVKEPEGLRIRWFTPEVEVSLCGHATLASGKIIFEYLKHESDRIELNCLSGAISVDRIGDILQLNFPIDTLIETECPENLVKSLGMAPNKTYKGGSDHLLIYDNQEQIEQLNPNFNLMKTIPARGCIVTAPGNTYDVVCRGFFPQSGINEDPATGSAQTTLAAYWPEVLSKNDYSASQLSKRKGYFNTEKNGDRVLISGKCRVYMKGEIHI